MTPCPRWRRVAALREDRREMTAENLRVLRRDVAEERVAAARRLAADDAESERAAALKAQRLAVWA